MLLYRLWRMSLGTEILTICNTIYNQYGLTNAKKKSYLSKSLKNFFSEHSVQNSVDHKQKHQYNEIFYDLTPPCTRIMKETLGQENGYVVFK